MRNAISCLVVGGCPLILTALLTAAGQEPGAQPPAGFVPLFNGKDLAGWNGKAWFNPYQAPATSESQQKALAKAWSDNLKKHWRVDNGELVNNGNDAYLTTDKEFGDIELLAEYKITAKSDGAIYLRGVPQVQIVDSSKSANKKDPVPKGSGGLQFNEPGKPGNPPLTIADKPVGQWNKLRIMQVGERTSVFLNDKLVVDHARMVNFWDPKLPLPRKGPIQLLSADREVRWRNLYVREVPSEEANAILAKHGAKGFEPVFNGKDFTGWGGPIAQYEVKDGAIVCRPKKGGTIYTKEEYSDFVARVEFKLPPAGNNGLAIRYPGDGDTAYVGMCEIQVLDDSSPQYAKVDHRQYNGSAYGMVPAHLGYLRPLGEWNFEEVTVIGPTIKVELNGTRILDCDLSKVTQYLANKAHPGKDRKSGHFGFAGHNDPVAFRQIEIKRVEGK